MTRLLICALLLAGSARADARKQRRAHNPRKFDIVSHRQLGANKIHWVIERPDVRRRLTRYRQIRFQPGDRVVVRAHGCVNRKGSGNTTYRYVNPVGPQGNGRYSGLIYIPGATPDLVRIGGWAGRTLVIPPDLKRGDLYLRLGYEDAGYGWNNNDYKDNDYDLGNSPDGQCDHKAHVPARVEIEITRGSNAPATHRTEPLDLVWEHHDDNGLPLNPRWHWQGSRPGHVPNVRQICKDLGTMRGCTSQAPSADGTNACHGYEKPVGHQNFFPATYEGTLIFENANKGVDWDADLLLKRKDHAGLTTANRAEKKDAYWLEFDVDETLMRFGSPWWSMFRKKVLPFGKPGPTNWIVGHPEQSAGNNKEVIINREGKKLIPGNDAVIVGQFGLDLTDHDWKAPLVPGAPKGSRGGYTELHPVYAAAIRTGHKPNPAADHWVFFARNKGNEGDCAGKLYHMDIPELHLRIPFKGATGVKVKAGSLKVHSTHPRLARGPTGVKFVPAGHGREAGALLTFKLPDSDRVLERDVHRQGAVIDGEVTLEWTTGK